MYFASFDIFKTVLISVFYINVMYILAVTVKGVAGDNWIVLNRKGFDLNKFKFITCSSKVWKI